MVAALTGFGQATDDKQATFFMGRVRYSSSDGNDCMGVGQELMQLVSRASTIKVQEERKVRLTDPELFETPFLFMNGHNDFVLTESELANLRQSQPRRLHVRLRLLHQPGFSEGLASGVQPGLRKRGGETHSLRPLDLPLLLQA
jgi:hypothetical protein